ncbi:MAG: DUF1801 domain-containing protein [Actinobacteria bacterium]|nr:DUF1801 domain-containing protein [Actinomycetota bacterium]
MGVFTDLIDSTDGATREALLQIRDRALAAAPDAVEDLSYGVPALKYRGRPLVGVQVRAAGLSLFPYSSTVVAEVAPELTGFSLSKGTIRFSAGQPIPEATLARIVALRLAEIERAG